MRTDLSTVVVRCLEEIQGPSEEEKARRRVLIAEDEARLAALDKKEKK